MYVRAVPKSEFGVNAICTGGNGRHGRTTIQNSEEASIAGLGAPRGAPRCSGAQNRSTVTAAGLLRTTADCRLGSEWTRRGRLFHVQQDLDSGMPVHCARCVYGTPEIGG
ncbi:hypothetical protein L227DRAFT_341847 [Lentinus tigrinus ALCF2SS1-6]|uniref:Uncharacterized protein n=1 Tax=Lentinus tigrinus ALCF2SS1-6 TaxID=1328759 RepID=A0A5C2RUU4_9APHY|nr:hypothetical protein L227DRAFT_341847 [Lentinus tigrinus ALCF2SS1-6]